MRKSTEDMTGKRTEKRKLQPGRHTSEILGSLDPRSIGHFVIKRREGTGKEEWWW
jgi:hypothetical protein